MNNSFADLTLMVPINACETVSGRYVDVVDPQPDTITVYDIAWSLSRQARFAGHTMCETVWNVAQHSLFVESLLSQAMEQEPNCNLWQSLKSWLGTKNYDLNLSLHALGVVFSRVRMAALMHDGTEAYLVDLPSPVKRHQALREPYKEMEGKMKLAIDKALGLEEITPLEELLITWADLFALQIEAANLMPSRGRGWAGVLPQMSLVDINVMPEVLGSRESFEAFIKRYNELSLSVVSRLLKDEYK